MSDDKPGETPPRTGETNVASGHLKAAPTRKDSSAPAGFVSLSSIKRGAPDAATALVEIRKIYFKTSRRTIDHDFAHAIELLKSLPDEETRQKAHVYMEGLAEMRKEWAKPAAAKKGGGTGKRAKRAKTGSRS